MLKPISKDDVLSLRVQEPSAMRAFAREALEEFFGGKAGCEACEVTGFPKVKPDPVENAAKLVSALNTELFCMRKKGLARVRRRKERVFVVREKPVRAGNPYPGD